MRSSLTQYSRLLLGILLTLSTTFLAAQTCATIDGGMLAFDNGGRTLQSCLDDGDPPVTFTRTGFVGGQSLYFITRPNGDILDVSTTGSPLDLSRFGDVPIAIWSVSYLGNLVGADIGDNVCFLGSTGCFDLSSPIVADRRMGAACSAFCQADGGNLALADGSGDVSTSLCIVNGAGATIDVMTDGTASGDLFTFVITQIQTGCR